LAKGLRLVFQSADSLIAGDLTVSRLGLEVPDGSLSALKELLGVLARGDLLTQCLVHAFKLIGAGELIVACAVIGIPMYDGNRNLAVTNKPTRRTV
jgi:hypothetical protein